MLITMVKLMGLTFSMSFQTDQMLPSCSYLFLKLNCPIKVPFSIRYTPGNIPCSLVSGQIVSNHFGKKLFCLPLLTKLLKSVT